jgi:Flp pilus assembly pilin Flp
MRNRKGQTLLEYTVIFIVILGVMIAMKDYMKRGVQGRWKSASDDMGDQYDPRFINSNIMYSTQSNSQSIVTVQNGEYGTAGSGEWTSRTDSTNSLDQKTGFSQVGS